MDTEADVQHMDSESVYSLFSVQSNGKSNVYKVTMTINEVQCLMEIDTGAGVTVLNDDTLKQIEQGQLQVRLQPSSTV